MPRTMIGQQTRALRASKCYEDFYAGRALVHGRTHVNTPGMTHQGTVLCMHYWRIVGKADGMLKDDGMLKEGNVRERETFKGRESSTTREGFMKEREMLRERKTLREGNINGRKTAREGRC